MLTIGIVGAVEVSAHRRDEYLQAARLAIDPGRVRIDLDLTPGMALADAILAEIDRDRDGVLSADEQQAYGRIVLSAVAIEVDGKPVRAQLDLSSFPDIAAMTRGDDAIRLQVAAQFPAVSTGAHHVLFRNGHHPDRSVYLANALVPASDRVSITAQRRDGDQRELVIEYVVSAPSASPTLAWLVGSIGGATLISTVWMRRSRRTV